jgi:hypothetical protein
VKIRPSEEGGLKRVPPAGLRLISASLACSAFAVNLFFANFEGILVAILLSSTSLFFYLYLLSPSKRILHLKLQEEDLFFACAGVTLFVFLNVGSKILLPYALSSYSHFGLTILELLIASVLCYGLLLHVGGLVRHNDFLNESAMFAADEELRDRYERVGNAVIVAAVFLALDSLDIMLLTSIILLSSRFLIQGISRVLAAAGDFLQFLGSRGSIRSRTHQFSKLVERADLEDALWRRVLYVSRYKRGLAYLLLAVMNGLPSIIYSYNLNLLHLQPGRLGIFLLLSIPGIITVYTLKLPRGLVATAEEAGRLRQLLILASMAAPIATIPLAYLYPSVLGFTGANRSVFDSEIVGTFFGYVWMTVFPLFVGFPLYSMIAAAEMKDIRGFIVKARIFGASPALVVAPMSTALILSQGISSPSSMVIFMLHFGITCYFYVFILLASIHILRYLERRSGKSMDNWIRKIRGPTWSVYLLDALLGAIFFPLLVFSVPFLQGWIRIYEGVMLPGTGATVVWIVGGLVVSLVTFPLLDHKTSLNVIKSGLVGSLIPLALAISFLGVLEDSSTIRLWALWILAIPTDFIVGTMITLGVITRVLRNRGVFHPQIT